jgi:hypothetical protein
MEDRLQHQFERVEVFVNTGSFSQCLTDMREWLDRSRFEPCRFEYDTFGETVLIRIDFKRAAEAAAFGRQFGAPLRLFA